MIFKEKKEDLIKVFEIEKENKISYLVNTFVHILNRWKKIRIYVYNIEKNGK